MPNEDRLAAPHHGDRLALGHRSKIDLGRGHRQGRRVRIHHIQERPQSEAEADGGKAACSDHDHVAPRRVFFFGKRELCGSYMCAVGHVGSS
jgi:hypothetical protein